MEETDKIWMNGELDRLGRREGARRRPRAPLRLGRVRGHPVLRDAQGARRLPARRPHAAPARLRAAALHGHPVLGRGAPRGDARPRARQRAPGVLHPPDRVLRLRPARRLNAGKPGRDGDHELALGCLPRRGRAREGDHDLHLVVEARRRRTRSRTPRRRAASTSTRCSRPPRRAAAATTRGSCSPTTAYVADGPGENIFVVKNGVIRTPPLSTSILPGLTRDAVITIAQDLGYVVEESPLIRSDLYLADEFFMTGTAAEVTPVRAVDDQELGVGPVTREMQGHYLDTVNGRSDRWSHWLDVVDVVPSGGVSTTAPDRPLGSLARRARGGARRRGASLGQALARPVDRPLRGGVRRSGRRAVRGRGLERNGGLAPPLRRRRHRARATR